jgi:hypothetical protein
MPTAARRHLRVLGPAVAALVIVAAGCGSGATTTSSGTTAPPPSTGGAGSGTAAHFEAILTEEGVEQDAAGAVLTASTTASDDQAALQALHAQWEADDAALRALPLTGQAGRDLPAMLSANAAYEAGVAKAESQGDPKSIEGTLSATNPDLIDRTPAAAAVTKDLGLPAKEPWFGPQPAGPLVYRDDFTKPGTFATGQGSTEADGTLSVVYGNGSVSTSEASTHAFDGRNTTTQVSVTLPSSGNDVRAGLLCPDVGKKVAVGGGVEGDGKWALFNYDISTGSTTIFAADNLPAGAGLTHTVRLDCQQYAPGIVTARLYVDGSRVGEQSLGGQLPADETQPDASDPAVLAVNAGTAPATFLFHDFSVATLAAPPAPPVPFST